jgi:hypothetical protein
VTDPVTAFEADLAALIVRGTPWVLLFLAGAWIVLTLWTWWKGREPWD